MTRLVPIVCGQVFTLVVGVLGLKLVSQFLSPEIFGTYALLLTLTGLGMQFTHAGLYNHAIRCWQREAAANRAGYVGFLWREHWRATGPLLWLVAGVGVGVGLWQGEAFWLWSVPVLVLANVAQTSSGLAQGVLNAAERHWAVFGVTGTALATRTLLPLASAVWLGASLPALLGGLATHALVVTWLLITMAGAAGRRRDADAVAQARWTNELRGYTRPYFWLGVGGWLLQSADRWLVFAFLMTGEPACSHWLRVWGELSRPCWPARCSKYPFPAFSGWSTKRWCWVTGPPSRATATGSRLCI